MVSAKHGFTDSLLAAPAARIAARDHDRRASPQGGRPLNHLEYIAIRQRRSQVRDAIFAVFVALGTIASISVMSTVVHAASTHLTSR